MPSEYNPALDWSQEEVEATVADYFDMLYKERMGIEFNKSEHRRHLSQLLNKRSDGAIERKHQNISAILIDLGFAYISGYKPLKNYQQLLFDIVAERLDENQALVQLVSTEVAAPAEVPSVADILRSWVEAPKHVRGAIGPKAYEVRDRSPQRKRIDYLAKEARNRSLGIAGEEFVLQFEIVRLEHAGKERLASKVERVSETQGDGVGFDILSFEESGQERLIEVKTTNYGPMTPFFVSRNELEVSQRTKEIYHLYRAFDFRRQPRIFGKPGPLDQTFNLESSQFVASII